jgi:hypothetical protein
MFVIKENIIKRPVEIICSDHKVYLYVLYGSQKKQLFVRYTALSGFFLQLSYEVFTTQYELNI